MDKKAGTMAIFTFSVQTQIQFGAGVSLQAGTVAQSLLKAGANGANPSVLVISDPGIQGTNWLSPILESLPGCGLQYEQFEEVRPNPREEDVYKAASLLTEKHFGAIIAIGGGSTIDTAKTAALIATHAGKVGDYVGWAKVPGPTLPLVAIPTTAGSGSEATCWAVITESRSHAKLAIGDRNLAPRAALVDPALTVSLPASITAATGMDVLTHAIEAYVSCLSNPLNDALALEAIRLVATHLRKAVTNGGDLAAREGMMLASTLGGIAINNSDVAGVHCLSEGIGGLYDAPHGLINAILLPYFMAFWQSGCVERFVHIAEAFGATARAEEAVTCVNELNRSLGLPSLSELGVKHPDLPKLAALAEANVSNPSNPVPMGAADYLHILERAMAAQPMQA
jgi:alcohol dehydrogenase